MRDPGLRPDPWTWAALSLATAALAVRGQDAWAVAATVAAGLVGLVVAAPREPVAGAVAVAAALAVGAAAVVAVWRLWPAPPAASDAIWVAVVAAVAEELLFRRALYARLVRWGPAVAIGVTAVGFALVHVRVYGWAVVPLDAAAGAVLGWQRWTSGTWLVPAATHAFANLVQVT